MLTVSAESLSLDFVKLFFRMAATSFGGRCHTGDGNPSASIRVCSHVIDEKSVTKLGSVLGTGSLAIHLIFANVFDDGHVSTWVLGIVAAVLLFVLPFILPKERRLAVRSPFFLFCLSGVFYAILSNTNAGSPIRPPYMFFSFLFLFCSVGRSLYLLAAKSLIAPIFVRSLPTIVLDVIQVLIFCVAVLSSLFIVEADVDVGEITKYSLFIGAFVGILVRHTIENIVAGLTIQFQKPFEVLDWIEFDHQLYEAQRSNNIGKVLEINWRATRVITLDEVEVTIPNSKLAEVAIRNYTKPQRYSRRSLYVVTPYGVPPRVVSRIIVDAIRDSWGVEQFPEPSVVTNAFTERGVEHWVRIFTKEFGKRDKVDGAARDRIWYALQRNGIAIPGPIRRVELKDVNRKALEAEERILTGERKNALKCVDFLDELSEEEFDMLAESVQLRQYSEGEVIVRQGDDGTELFIIKSGEVAASIELEDTTIIELNRMGPSQFFGEVSFMTGKLRTATISVTKDSEIFVVGKESFQPILADSPSLVEHMSDVLASRQAEVDNRVDLHQTQRKDTDENSMDLLEHIKAFFSLG